jgi:predicted AAA+ superfamily ATPase
MVYVKRSLEGVISEVTTQFPVILVTGPRQVGKTTMLKKMSVNTKRTYVSLDDIHQRVLAKTDPELFLKIHKPPVLIDEVQYAPELFTYIKMYVDESKTSGAY